METKPNSSAGGGAGQRSASFLSSSGLASSEMSNAEAAVKVQQKEQLQQYDTAQKGESEYDDSDEDSLGSSSAPDDTKKRASGSKAGSSGRGGSGGTSVVDQLASLRREKRLAMNRESARNRRKRKKMLIQTLEAQNAELVRSNQHLQLTNEALSAKVQALQSELNMARTTIGQLQISAQQHHQPQRSFGGPSASVLGAAVGGLGADTLRAQQTQTYGQQQLQLQQQQFRPSMQQAPGDPTPRGDNLGRLMQAQLEHLAFQQQQQHEMTSQHMHPQQQQQHLLLSQQQHAAAHMSHAAALASPYATTNIPASGTGYGDESILRRHALDIHALSQASRDTALGSMAHNVTRGGSSTMQQSERSEGHSPGLHPTAAEQFHQNALASPHHPDLGGLGDSRLSINSMDALQHHNFPGQPHSLTLGGALDRGDSVPANLHHQHHHSQQHVVEELLRQQQQHRNQAPRFSPPKH